MRITPSASFSSHFLKREKAMAESQIKLNEEREALAQKFGELRPQLGLHVQNTVIEAFKEGALSTKVKRLMALAIALGVGCRNCELHQAMSALDEGTTTEEILEVMDVVVSIRGTTGVAESLRIIQLLDELGKL
jgi:alkylhydroperoxidase/carboxymuconolactone decarboxylase family protein YurZ